MEKTERKPMGMLLLFLGVPALLLLVGYLLMTRVQAGEPLIEVNREVLGWNLISMGALVVDARTPEEFASGHLEGAINIPHDQTVARIAEYGSDKDRTIVVYCRSGRRSGIAQGLLEEHGFSSAHNGGGYEPMLAAKP
jgi:phage shock protein E